jgi:WD40 repeat protein
MNAKLILIGGMWRVGLSLLVAAPLTMAAQTAGTIWTQSGHAAQINALAGSVDGSVIATASDDNTAKLWTTNGTLLRTISTRPYQATAVAISPDGLRLAVGTYSGGYLTGNLGSGNQNCAGLGQVFVWQAPNGWAATNVSLVWSNNNRFGKVTSLAFSVDGSLLVSGDGGGSNFVQQAATGALVTSLAGFNSAVGPALVTSVGFSANGMMASGAEDGTLRAWNSSWGQVGNVINAQASNITAVAFSSSGAYLASASLDQTIRVWDTSAWIPVQTIHGPANGITALAFSADGTTLASGNSNGTINLWNWPSGTALGSMAAHADVIRSLLFLPDGKRLVSGSADNTAKIWSVPGDGLLQALGSYSATVRSVALSANGSLCATADDTQTIQVRRTGNGQVVLSLAGQNGCVSAIAFSPDSTELAAGGGPLDPSIKVWRVSDGALLRTIAATTNGVMALAFSPDGSMLAAGGDSVEQTITLWNTADGSLRATLPGHTNGVTTLAFSPNGGLLASGGRRFDNLVKVWSLTNYSVIQQFAGHANNIEAVAFGPDNDTVASGSSGTSALFVSKISAGTTRVFGTGTNPVYFVAFTPDGSTLAAANKDAIQFWTVAAGTISQTVTNETLQAKTFAYSPNGNFYFYGRDDATVVLAANSLGAMGQPALLFNSAAKSPSGLVSLGAAVQPWSHYVIQSSLDLQQWSFLTTASSPSNSMTILDPAAGYPPLRFYRAVTPP